MQTALRRAATEILHLLFPPYCGVCNAYLKTGDRSGLICGTCLTSIAVRRTLTCPTCGARLAENRKTCHTDTAFRLAAAMPYQDDRVQKLIWALKYQKKTWAARPLAACMAAHLASLPLSLEGYTIVPLPLHRTRKRERGFNQAELLGEFLAKRTALPVQRHALVRKRHTKPQAEAEDYATRAANVANAFGVKKPSCITGKNVLLVDDVLTSGATAAAAARALRDAGQRMSLSR
jgi:ComF family protein